MQKGLQCRVAWKQRKRLSSVEVNRPAGTSASDGRSPSRLPGKGLRSALSIACSTGPTRRQGRSRQRAAAPTPSPRTSLIRRAVRVSSRTLGLRWVGVDALVNNVATEEGDNDPLTLEVDGWQRVMDVNLRAMWLTCRAVLPIMQDQRAGTIVNTSSLGSRTAGGSLFAYGMSKAGVDALTHKLAVMFAPWGIRCNSVLPAWVATQHSMDGLMQAGVASSEEEIFAFARRANPLGRMGTAWDVANAVLFLSSDESCHTTGVNFPVDGGTSSVIGQYQRPKNAP